MSVSNVIFCKLTLDFEFASVIMVMIHKTKEWFCV